MPRIPSGGSALSCATAILAIVQVAGCRSPAPVEAPEVTGGYVVLADSSRAYAVVQRGGEAVVATFPQVLGALTFRQGGQGDYLEATGTFTVPLAAVLDDSLQAQALATTFFETNRGPEFKTAELRVRRLSGPHFRASLPVGGTAPALVEAQLLVHQMAVSRQFEVRITRTPTGFRITNPRPALFSISELRMEEQRDAWLTASGGGELADGVIVSVDVLLVRRGPAGTGT